MSWKTKNQQDPSGEIPFLGRGWGFPPEFNKVSGGLELSAGNNDIRNSLTLLLSTLPGERKITPQYGIDLSDLLFEKINISLQTRVTDLIRRKILAHEPRILLEDVHYRHDPAEGILYITLAYTIRTTNTRTNMVYPFYLKEGTDL